MLLAVVAIGLAACGPSTAPRSEPDPHVLLYLVDTLRSDRLGAYGYGRPTSPTIDRLAEHAIVFEDAFAPAPWTLPSVVSLMTSTSPLDHGVLETGQRIGPHLVPLHRRLAAMGFQTGAFVANPLAGRKVGLGEGYDHFRNLRSKPGPGVAVDRWLDQASPGPKFIYVHTIEPHRPLQPPVEFVERFGKPRHVARINALLNRYGQLQRAAPQRGSRDEQQAVLGHVLQLKRAIDDLYDGEVAWADARLGEVIEVLKRRGMWNRTLLVLVSDHGEEFLEHGGLMHGHSLYAEVAKIPMIWRFPEDRWGGRRVEGPVTLLDVVPTLLDYLGESGAIEGLQGRSLLPRIRGEAPATEPVVTSVRANRAAYFGPFKNLRGELNIAVVDGRWRGIWNVEGDSFELYDVEVDPLEVVDRAAEETSVVARLRAETQRWLAARPPLEDAGPLEETEPWSPESLEQLRTLGYVD
jgi:arylsulfatase A-like enzyme